MNSTLRILFAICSIAIFVLTGCKSNSTSSMPGNTLTVPKAGSSFTYVNTFRDTNGAVTSIDTSIQRFLKTNYAIGGVTDAIMLEETSSDGTKDTSYLRFTPGGDVQAYLFSPNQSFIPEWLTVPVSSHTPQRFTHDTIMSSPGVVVYDSSSIVIQYQRAENNIVKGTTYSCNVVSLTTETSELYVSGSQQEHYNSMDESELSFSPTIGWVTHQKPVINISDGSKGETSESVLIDFTLAN